MLNVIMLAALISSASVLEDSTAPSIRYLETGKFVATAGYSTPRIDGNLDDECWKNAPVISDFIVSQPNFGHPCSEKTEVRVLYDDNALYIGAYLFDKEASGICHQLCERDGSAQADNFAIGLDTYNDNINGYRFQVSASGVQTDMRLSQGTGDVSWDAVWISKTALKPNGWVAEIKIPYSAIRFAKGDNQTWGLQFARLIQRKNELSSWSPVNPQISGVVNQWGEWRNLRKLNPPPRLSLIPYFTAGYLREPSTIIAGKFANKRILNGGLDINWGINEGFTLNTTLVPDFGQVLSDNVVLNLGPFEQQFQERRPFFTEATELFNRSVGLAPGQLFYSRRIGQAPSRYYDIYSSVRAEEELLFNPSITQLYNATKISGRTKGDLGIGVLNAISAPMYADIKNTTTGKSRKEMTEPLANYNMLVLDQSLKNNSRIGIANTSVIRAGNWRDANVTQLMFDFHDKSNTYSYSGFANLSQVYDKSINNKPQIGGFANFIASKTSGNVRFDFQQYFITDQYDQNDLGILFHGNEVSTFAGIKYLDFQPKKHINNWNASVGVNYTSLYKPFAYQDLTINLDVSATFKNFWYIGAFATSKPVRYFDYYEARAEGVKFNRYANGYMNLYWGSDQRKTFFVESNVGFAESPVKNDVYFEAQLKPTLRIKDKVVFSHDFFWSRDNKNFGFATYDENGIPVIGARKLYNTSNTFSARFTVTPLMYMIFRARHYWSKAVFTNHYYLDSNGELSERNFIAGTSRNFNSWNIDFVYDWRFAPGSDLIFTWKQIVYQSDNDEQGNYLANVHKTFETPLTNSLAVKLIYYLDYAQMKEWNDKRKASKNMG
ncbi:MAG: DUF5916 domain-containing protein [Chitinophagales bacterium]